MTNTIMFLLLTTLMTQDASADPKKSVSKLPPETIKLSPTIRVQERGQQHFEGLSCKKALLIRENDYANNKQQLRWLKIRKQQCQSRLKAFH